MGISEHFGIENFGLAIVQNLCDYYWFVFLGLNCPNIPNIHTTHEQKKLLIWNKNHLLQVVFFWLKTQNSKNISDIISIVSSLETIKMMSDIFLLICVLERLFIVAI